jgi:hypothetical protein
MNSGLFNLACVFLSKWIYLQVSLPLHIYTARSEGFQKTFEKFTQMLQYGSTPPFTSVQTHTFVRNTA